MGAGEGAASNVGQGKGVDGKNGDSINIYINNTNMSTQDMVGMHNSSVKSTSCVQQASSAYEVQGQNQGMDLQKLLEMMMMLMMLKMMNDMMGDQGG